MSAERGGAGLGEQRDQVYLDIDVAAARELLHFRQILRAENVHLISL
jgi:hypothetical protein